MYEMKFAISVKGKEKRLLVEEIKKVPVTASLILLNVLVFVLVEAGGSSENVTHMLECGAAYAPAILENGEVYRLFTSMFLHFGMEHLLNNMLVLFVLGQRLEPVIGKARFLLIYLLGGLGGNLLSLAEEMRKQSFNVSAGASGAVFAVMGAMIYALVRHRGKIQDLSMKQLLIMAAFSLYFGFTSSGVDNAAHVGGMVSGFLFAVILYHPRKIRKTEP
jgi:rhomboid protease GluP